MLVHHQHYITTRAGSDFEEFRDTPASNRRIAQKKGVITMEDSGIDYAEEGMFIFNAKKGLKKL